MVIAVPRDQHQPGGKTALRGIGKEMAQRSKKFTMTVLRKSMAFFRAKLSAAATSAMVGATIGVVGIAKTSRSASAASIEADQARPFPHHIDIVGSADVARPFEAYSHIRVDWSARRDSSSRCTANASAGGRLPCVHLRHIAEQRKLLFKDLCTGLP